MPLTKLKITCTKKISNHLRSVDGILSQRRGTGCWNLTFQFSIKERTAGNYSNIPEADYYATSNELVLLRKEKLIASHKQMFDGRKRRCRGLHYQMFNDDKGWLLNNIRPKTGESTSLESLPNANDTEAMSIESFPDVTDMEAIEPSEYQQCESFTESSSKSQNSRNEISWNAEMYR